MTSHLPAGLDLSGAEPALNLPRQYNAASDFVDRHLAAGRGDKIAVIDDQGSYSYLELAERVNRAGNALRDLGVEPEQRVMMCLLDSVDFIAVFFGAIKIGAVPIPLNTLLTSDDYDYILSDSRAKVLVVSMALWDRFDAIVADKPRLQHVVQSGIGGGAGGDTSLSAIMAAADPVLETIAGTPDDACFWLYSSGSTGRPKGVVHSQGDLAYTATYYGIAVLGITENDTVFSAAKLFFAYGLGNAMSFPLYVGATAILMAERPTPQAIAKRLETHKPEIFYGVPTLYAAMLAEDDLANSDGLSNCRICVSAGEALPIDVAQRWQARYGVDILDGIGSTEMLHIFLSNRIDDLRLGTTGKAVPGYVAKIVDDQDVEVATGELGELVVMGGSSGTQYWGNRAKSLATFRGAWTYTGDKYVQDEDGYFIYAGRTDDMLKVSGIWVSPFEVESALIAHDAVLEAAVVGAEDDDKLIKPKAYVVLAQTNDGAGGNAEASAAELAAELKAFVKDRLAPYKYPRWIEFREELPKTATGKIQRFKLRD